MSAMPIAHVASAYRGDSGFVYLGVNQYTSSMVQRSVKHSMFYQVFRILTAIITIGFGASLFLSIYAGGPIHWTLSVVGLLGSIGFTGAVWLSEPYLRKNSAK